MSDYPMLISNKLHSFRNFDATNILIFINIIHFKLTFLPVCLSISVDEFPLSFMQF